MKIHIVQKGDTIWDIAEKYGVDFEEVIELNPQISSPDMIMPGMKIKIPSTSKQVKQETGLKEKQIKEKPKEAPKHTPHKPIKMITEDDHKQTKEIPIKEPTEIIKESPKLVEHPKINMPLMPIIPENIMYEKQEYKHEEKAKVEKPKKEQPKVKHEQKEAPQVQEKITMPTYPEMQMPLETPKFEMEELHEQIPYHQPFMPAPVMPCYCQMMQFYQPCGCHQIKHPCSCCGHQSPYQMMPVPYGIEQQFFAQNIPMQTPQSMPPYFGYNYPENDLSQNIGGPQYGHMQNVRSDQNFAPAEGDLNQSLKANNEKSNYTPPIFPNINDFENSSDYE